MRSGRSKRSHCLANNKVHRFWADEEKCGRPLLVLHSEKLETIDEEHSELESGRDK